MMSTMTIAGREVQIDDEGFMIEPSEWTDDLAEILAKNIGIDTLGDGHWKVIRFLREDFDAQGETPGLRRITTEIGISTKELFQLFPKKPGKKMSYVAGVPKPKGCV
jgi:TusE/DsrC/DsvC family sulfur relay protein